MAGNRDRGYSGIEKTHGLTPKGTGMCQIIEMALAEPWFIDNCFWFLYERRYSNRTKTTKLILSDIQLKDNEKSNEKGCQLITLMWLSVCPCYIFISPLSDIIVGILFVKENTCHLLRVSFIREMRVEPTRGSVIQKQDFTHYSQRGRDAMARNILLTKTEWWVAE